MCGCVSVCENSILIFSSKATTAKPKFERKKRKEKKNDTQKPNELRINVENQYQKQKKRNEKLKLFRIDTKKKEKSFDEYSFFLDFASKKSLYHKNKRIAY